MMDSEVLKEILKNLEEQAYEGLNFEEHEYAINELNRALDHLRRFIFLLEEYQTTNPK
jgi:hypothetical protein